MESQISENLFHDEFGRSVRIGGVSGWRRFWKWRLDVRCIIDGTTWWKKNGVDRVLMHYFKERQGSHNIVLVIRERMCTAVTDCLQRRKVYDRWNGVFLKNRRKSFTITNIRFIKKRTNAGTILYTLDYWSRWCGEIVNNDHLVSGLYQTHYSMGTDKAGSSGNENGAHYSVGNKTVYSTVTSRIQLTVFIVILVPICNALSFWADRNDSSGECSVANHLA